MGFFSLALLRSNDASGYRINRATICVHANDMLWKAALNKHFARFVHSHEVWMTPSWSIINVWNHRCSMIRKGSFTLIIEYSLSKLGTSFIFIAWPKTPLFIYGRCFFQRLLPKIIKYIASSYTYARLHWSWNLSQPFCSSHYVTAYSNVYWISNSRPQWLFVVEFKIDQR